VDQPRVGMKSEDDRLVLGEELVEIHVAQPVRVLGLRLQLHEVDDVDYPDFQVGQMPRIMETAASVSQRGHVATADHDHIGRNALVVAGHGQMPMPSVQCLTAASIVSHCGAGCLPAITTLT